MKITRFSHQGRISHGLLIEDKAVDFGNIYRSLPELINKCTENSDEVLSEISKADIVDIKQVKLLTPFEPCSKLLALAGNYSEHIKECGLKLGLSESPKYDTVPRPFLMPSTAACADGDIINWSPYSEKIDYELELAVIIGKQAKCISVENTTCYIAGYCIANDISARDVSFSKNRKPRPWDEFYDWLNGKWSDNFLPLGPYITTKDEIEDANSLQMQLAVNGQIRQDANTSMMIFNTAEIVSFLSHIMTLLPGDIICTGTPSGVGHPKGRYLQEGDKIECRIDKLGKLTNILGKKPDKFYTPLVR
jgi:2-keto-4-pentenoate hydratase/2-oxohepta-3-ene-1,7-dioic acid hydratase in catechol pathway